MTRTQMTLGGILLVQVILILAFAGPFDSSTEPVERRPLLPDLEGLSPSKLEVQGAADTVVTLVRSGDGWAIEEAGGYPAEDGKVETLLETLDGLEVRRPVVSSSRYHSVLKVTDDEHERRLRLWDDASDDPQLDLYIGSSPNYRTTHVRLGGTDPVYEVAGLGVHDVRDTAGGWVTTSFVDAELENVTGFHLENAEGSLDLERLADRNWRVTDPAGMRDADLDTYQVEALIRAATGLNVAEPAGPIDRAAQGLESPGATAVLRLRVEPEVEPDVEPEAGMDPDAVVEPETREITLWVGGPVPDADTQRYVARSGFDFAARVWQGSVDKLVETTAADLEKKEAE